jgi:hypothetical protein
MYKQLVTLFWNDVEFRMRNMGVNDSLIIQETTRELFSMFYGLIFAYDEVWQGTTPRKTPTYSSHAGSKLFFGLILAMTGHCWRRHCSRWSVVAVRQSLLSFSSAGTSASPL